MAKRGRKPGAHFECDFIFTPMAQKMTATEWTLYSKLWILAVFERRDVICLKEFGIRWMCRAFSLSRNTVTKAARKLHEYGLILNHAHFIKVFGVVKKHGGMEWKSPKQCCMQFGSELNQIATGKPIPNLDLNQTKPKPDPNMDLIDPQFDQNNPGITLIQDWPQILSEAGLPFDAVPDMSKADRNLPDNAGLKALRETCEWAIEKWGYDKLRSRLLEVANEHSAGTRTLYSLKKLLQTPQIIEDEESLTDTERHNRQVLANYGKKKHE